jgi:hypothetical protein
MSASFDPKSVPGLSDKAKEAVGAVFEAMTQWQSETTKLSEKNTKQLLEKMPERISPQRMSASRADAGLQV